MTTRILIPLPRSPLFAFLRNAVEEFDLVHGRFGVVLGGFLDLEGEEYGLGGGGGGGGGFGGGNEFAILDHPDCGEVTPS